MVTHSDKVLWPPFTQHTPAAEAVCVASVLGNLRTGVGISGIDDDFVIVVLRGTPIVKLEEEISGTGERHSFPKFEVVLHWMDGLHGPTCGPWSWDLDVTWVSHVPV